MRAGAHTHTSNKSKWCNRFFANAIRTITITFGRTLNTSYVFIIKNSHSNLSRFRRRANSVILPKPSKHTRTHIRRCVCVWKQRLKVSQFNAKHHMTLLHSLFTTNFGDVIELKFQLEHTAQKIRINMNKFRNPFSYGSWCLHILNRNALHSSWTLISSRRMKRLLG